MIDELKEAIKSAKTDEEMEKVLIKYREEIKKLSDEELDMIAGGKILCPCGKDKYGICVPCD